MRGQTLIRWLAAAAIMQAGGGCYLFRSSEGGGEARKVTERSLDPADVAVPDGYQVEVVAQGLTFPTGIAFDEQGRPHVVEAGYSYGERFGTPRLLRILSGGRVEQVAAGGQPPWNGVAFADGAFFVAEGGQVGGGRIARITPSGEIQPLVQGLPGLGDHHTDGPAIGPDGWIYFGQGTATNSGVVGTDNHHYGWLARHPDFHDIPCRDVKLTGEIYETDNPLTAEPGDKATTGPFSPFGTKTEPGQVVRGALPCSGAVMRVRPDGTGLELFAWGFRNPYGLAFDPQGRLHVTDNAYDERGSRPVFGAGDVLWRAEAGRWYGWPDFAEGERVDSERFTPPGKPAPKPVLLEHPDTPPQPVARFGVHSSANGFDFSRSERFGHVGEAFVALFGDMAPETGKVLAPVGFKVVRVQVETGKIEEFAANRGKQAGPASRIGGGGFERPVAARFDPAGTALYVVDFGVLRIAEKGPEPVEGTGAVWRITPKEAP